MRLSAKALCCAALSLMLASMAFAADTSMFNYQGRVLVQGYPYNGPGRMKTAIIATSGTAEISLWSNDGASQAGSEPTGSFAVTVTGGVFDVMLGDPDAGMNALPAILLNRDDELKVRVWFNDGSHGFQQLAPDRRLSNPRRLGLNRVTAPLTIYVNASDGNDLDNGLTTDTAKRTVQAALDMLPRSIYAPTIVKLAPGDYAKFSVYGFTDMKSSLTIQGDPVNDPYAGQTLNVTMTSPTDTDSAIEVVGSKNIILTGIATQNFFNAINVMYGSNNISVIRCKTADFGWGGICFSHNSNGLVDHCLSTNGGRGFQLEANCHISLNTSIAEYNGTGLFVYWNSSVAFGNPILRYNTQYGILSRYNCVMASMSNISLVGNATNLNFGTDCNYFY